jgi:hypothetical protein
MPVIKHVHDDECDYSDGFIHYLVEAAPGVLWFNIQDVGSYQGCVYAVGLFEGKYLIYEDYYGSCSGCGAWGEGGEPSSLNDVISNSTLFITPEEASDYLGKIDKYEAPNIQAMRNAINKITEYVQVNR